MRLSFFVFLGMLVSLSTQNSIADTCKIQTMESKLTLNENGRTNVRKYSERISKKELLVEEEMNAPEECYQLAVEIVSSMELNERNEEIPVYPVAWITQARASKDSVPSFIPVYTWMSWTYGDGIIPINRYRGRVNVYTRLFTGFEYEGDRRFTIDGRLIVENADYTPPPEHPLKRAIADFFKESVSRSESTN